MFYALLITAVTNKDPIKALTGYNSGRRYCWWTDTYEGLEAWFSSYMISISISFNALNSTFSPDGHDNVKSIHLSTHLLTFEAWLSYVHSGIDFLSVPSQSLREHQTNPRSKKNNLHLGRPRLTRATARQSSNIHITHPFYNAFSFIIHITSWWMDSTRIWRQDCTLPPLKYPRSALASSLANRAQDLGQRYDSCRVPHHQYTFS